MARGAFGERVGGAPIAYMVRSSTSMRTTSSPSMSIARRTSLSVSVAHLANSFSVAGP